ncbi:MAG: DUF6386 family protein [Bacillota bacterium]
MNVASSPFHFTTDTATFCLFDTEALKHRLDDEPDWWSVEEDELGELNQGNVAFFNLRADGTKAALRKMEKAISTAYISVKTALNPSIDILQ